VVARVVGHAPRTRRDGLTVSSPAVHHHGRETLEFARLVNLSDAVFAIAMTLLVLGLEVPAVEPGGLVPELAGAAPQLVAFLLGFALVANIWWQHHKLFGRLAYVDRGLVAMDLALLCAVAIVPFPTALLGRHPTERAAVLAFVAVFVLLLLLFLWLTVHAQRIGAWTRPMPAPLYPWVVGGFAVTVAMMLVAAAITLWWPLAGLVVLAGSNLPEVLLARRAPSGYRDWA
jgi:uncharacterized membrane protein